MVNVNKLFLNNIALPPQAGVNDAADADGDAGVQEAGDVFVHAAGGGQNDALQNVPVRRANTIAAGIVPLLSPDITVVKKNALRQQLMTMEALLDLYRGQHPTLKDCYREVKRLEDAIGQSREPQSPEEQEASDNDLRQLLETAWTAPAAGQNAPAMQRIFDAIAATDFGTDADDAAFLREKIVGFVDRVGETDYDMNDLQGPQGIHDLRKDVRWVGYYLDLAETGGGPTNLLPQELVDGYTQAAGDLGDIKDRGEEADALARKIQHGQGLPYEEARKLAGEQLGEDYTEAKIFADSAVIYASLKTVYAKFKDVIHNPQPVDPPAPPPMPVFNAIALQAMEDKRITGDEAKAIVASTQDKPMLRAVLGQAGLEFALAANRTLNRALPKELRTDIVANPPADAMSPAAQLWATYYPGEAVPTDRATVRFAGLLLSLAEGDQSRQMLWNVQCLLKLYRKGETPDLDAAYEEVKALEDAAGKTAEPGTPAEQAAHQAAYEKLIEERWTAGADGKIPAIASMLDNISTHEFGTDEEDDKLLTRETLKQIKKIYTKNFDMSQLQGDIGLHELRRQLRWPAYNVSVTAMAGGPRVPVPQALMNAFSKAHMDLGSIKDMGELAEARARGFMEQDPSLTFEQARLKATEELGPEYAEDAIIEKAKGFYQEVRTAYEANRDAIEGPLNQ